MDPRHQGNVFQHEPNLLCSKFIRFYSRLLWRFYRFGRRLMVIDSWWRICGQKYYVLGREGTEIEKERERELVFNAQSTITVISGRENERVRERQRKREKESWFLTPSQPSLLFQRVREWETDRQTETESERDGERVVVRGGGGQREGEEWMNEWRNFILPGYRSRHRDFLHPALAHEWSSILMILHLRTQKCISVHEQVSVNEHV